MGKVRKSKLFARLICAVTILGTAQIIAIAQPLSNGKETPLETARKIAPDLDPASVVLSELLLENAALQENLDGSDHELGNLASYYTEKQNQCAANKPMARAYLSLAIAKYYRGKTAAKSTNQVSQVADEATVKLLSYQCAQNQKIIALLEELTKKK